MKKTKKIGLTILITLMIIGSLMLPVVIAAEDFTVNVTSTQNTALEAGALDFGDVTAGTTDTIEPTFTLNNTGNLYATVTAAFTTNIGGVYGFTNATYVISGTNFSLQSAAQAYTALGATVSGVIMTDDVPANTAEAWNARLVIPAGQQAVAYTGTVEITFS